MRGAKNTKFFLKPWPLIGVGGNATSPPLYPRQRDPVPILQEAGWARGPVRTGGNSRPHRDSIPHHPVRSSVAIPTELPGPPVYFLTHKNTTVI